MLPDFDPYSVLGVGRAVSPEQLKTASRQRARLAHPDFGGSAAKLAEVQIAFEVLSDPMRRGAYDQYRLAPNDPVAAARWADARQSAESAAIGRGATGPASEVSQLAARLEQSHGVRVLSGAILGLLLGGGVGVVGAMYTSVAMPIAVAIGGGIGLLGGAWAGASSSA